MARLIDSLTRGPIAGAEVSLIVMTLPRPRFHKCTSAADRSCRIEGMAVGSYDVQLKKLGYVDWDRRQRVTVTAGGEIELAF